jgi:serine protease DegS
MQKTLGSGVIVDVSGLILTNNHVINGADKIQVLLYDGRYTSAELVGIDTENDLAVLKINLEKLFAITPGRSKDIRVGDVVLAIGNPVGVGQSVSQGIVSATGRWNLGINDTENFIQTDAAVNPGNSGGALIDAMGNLIGINTAILDESGASSVGISFAVPADTAMNSLKQIVQYGEVRRVWLGFTITQLYTPSQAAGLTVAEVEINSPVDKAGLKPGDIITHINDHAINDVPTAKNIIGNIQPGTEIKIRIMRAGKELELTTIASLQPSSHTKT